jgi:hypothetical protein
MKPKSDPDAVKKFSPEWKAKISDGMRRAHAEKRAGGFGKMKVGRKDHQFAATWIIEDPDGEEIEVSNLREWCRANAHRFEPDPGCKMAIWERAAAGMRAAAPGNNVTGEPAAGSPTH